MNVEISSGCMAFSMEKWYNNCMKTIENTNIDNSNKTKDDTLSLEQENELLKQKNEELEAKIKFYEEQFRLSQHKKYGSSSEKTDSNQMSIFNEAEKLSAKPAEEPVMEDILVKRKNKRSKGRKTYEDLPIEEVYYTLAEDEKTCPTCNHALHEMKTEVRKELKIIPAQVKVVHHIKQVYACRHCDEQGTGGTIITASRPKPVLEGSMVSPSLLAFIMEQKYNQALPLYRQEKSFVNFGIDISRQNMAKWIMHGANNWLNFLYERMHFYLKQEAVVHADESPLQVLDEKKNSKGYMWLYASAEKGDCRMYLYEYQPSRSKNNPKKFLNGFKGYLQTDGYAGYNAVENVTQVGCFAHARRKFKEAINALPKDSKTTSTKAHEGLEFFNRLYQLEKQFKEMKLKPEERYEKRIEKTKLVLDELFDWLNEQKPKTLPKSKLGEAIGYSLNQWNNLIAFMKDGRIAIDNNLAERAIKPFVIGRKNYLFSKSPKGARASAMSYSIIETAKANNLSPFLYLSYLFEKLPNIDVENLDELDALLPWSKSIPDEIRLESDNNK